MFLAVFAGTTAAQALADCSGQKYLLFTNTDLSVYYDFIRPIREEMTVGFSAVVIAVYMVVFIIAAWAIQRSVMYLN